MSIFFTKDVHHTFCYQKDTLLISGVAFKKTFSYAGFEMQPKQYTDPKIALLNIELELKAERDNAEIRLESVEVLTVVLSFHYSVLTVLNGCRNTKRSLMPSGPSCTRNWRNCTRAVLRSYSPSCQLATLLHSISPIATCSALGAFPMKISSVQ